MDAIQDDRLEMFRTRRDNELDVEMLALKQKQSNDQNFTTVDSMTYKLRIDCPPFLLGF